MMIIYTVIYDGNFHSQYCEIGMIYDIHSNLYLLTWFDTQSLSHIVKYVGRSYDMIMQGWGWNDGD